jgi:hypothetical protein
MNSSLKFKINMLSTTNHTLTKKQAKLSAIVICVVSLFLFSAPSLLAFNAYTQGSSATIKWDNKNNQPVHIISNLLVKQSQPVEMQFGKIAYGYDSNANLSVHITDYPSHGQLSDVKLDAGSMKYTPDPGFTGIDHFVLRASDGNSFNQVKFVTVHVNDNYTLDS